MARSVELTFTQANQALSQCIPVTIINDTIIEGPESFIGDLNNTNNIPRLTLNPERTTINIGDDEGKQLTLILLCLSDPDTAGSK